MASDSLATNNGAKATLAAGKIVRVGATLYGGGTLAMLDAVRYELGEQKSYSDSHTIPLEEWVASVLIPWLRDYLRPRGLMEKESHGAEMFPAHMLVAHGSSFVQVDKGQAVVRFAEPYAATGSGMYDARGAMWGFLSGSNFVFHSDDDGAEIVARLGVEAAIANDIGCGPPVCVEWTQP